MMTFSEKVPSTWRARSAASRRSFRLSRLRLMAAAAPPVAKVKAAPMEGLIDGLVIGGLLGELGSLGSAGLLDELARFNALDHQSSLLVVAAPSRAAHRQCES
jgi:hypothetical protein